jgi:TDG/mug DNA glycosylase family protein
MLPDLLDENLRVVICGTAVANYSAKAGSYYAGAGNKFWQVLRDVGLTPIMLNSEEYQKLLVYRIGLTDLAKKIAGSDNTIPSDAFDIEGFEKKIQNYRPKVVCFNGKRTAEIYLRKKCVEFGFQKEKIASSRLFVAPSTSGVAKRWWDQKRWQELSDFIKK